MLTETSRIRDFPTLSEMTYLNTAAESIPPPCVHEAVEAYCRDKLHGMKGRDGHFAQVEACREVSARMLGLQPSEVSFCSCTSEAYNLLATALVLGPGDEVVVSDLEYPSGVTPWMQAPRAPTIRMWKSEAGALRAERLATLLNDRTKLVQVSLISFYNGHRVAWEPFRDMVRQLAPNALISADLTQALGRIVLDCDGADILVSSTHKWTLGIHGGCIVGIPAAGAKRLTTRAGGWFNIQNAFDPDRFERVVSKTGAPSFSVGMPNFVALYALNASLRYLETIGMAAITAHADPLVAETDAGLRDVGFEPMCAWDRRNPSGIVAFRHPRATEIHAFLLRRGIHVMHQAGRLRIAVHGYNTRTDIGRLIEGMAAARTAA